MWYNLGVNNFKKNNMKKIILLICGIFILAGCNQQDTLEKNYKNEGKGQVKNNQTEEEYIIDENDYVNSKTLIQNIEKTDLSEKEKNGLILMREEEKLAHDVYTYLYEKWGQKTFDNISNSEQTHTDSVKTLLDNYSIDDPVKDNSIGKFTSLEMKELYTKLILQGDKSLGDALSVGATVEDLDIKDLQDLLEITDNEDIRIVYQNLMKGSRNHLRAFIKQLEKNGKSYSVQYITNDEYKEIISSEQERGNLNSKGGRGMNSLR